MNTTKNDFLTVVELITEENGKYDAVEVWQYTDKTRRLHTDFIRNLDGIYSNDILYKLPVRDYRLMTESDYNETINANTDNYDFDWIYSNKKAVVLLIMVDYDTVID